MKKNQLNLKSSLWMLFLLFFSLASVQAQITAIVYSGTTNTTPNLAGSYSSFADLTTALNGITAMSGPLLIGLNAGSETAPLKGFTIGSPTLNAVLSSTNFISIGGAGSTTILNAGVGTSNGASATPDGILKIVGADNIYLSQIAFVDSNAASPTVAMEFGVALFKASATDGCKNIDIFNCTFNMQRINNAAGPGTMVYGQAAVMILNSTPLAATTDLVPTATSGLNTDNRIQTNTINGGNSGIIVSGYNAPSPYTLVDSGNSVENNIIENFGGGGTGALTAYGIVMRNNWLDNISYNYIENNNGSGVSSTGNLYGIVAGVATNNAVIENNTVKLKSANTNGSQLYGIFCATAAGGNQPGFTVTLDNNNIDLEHPFATSNSNIRGISCQSSAQNVFIRSNIIGGTGAGFASIGNVYGIYYNGAATTTTITNNTVRNLIRTGASGSLYGIYAQGSAATSSATTGPTNITATGNTITNLGFTTLNNSGTVYAIYTAANTINNTVSNNIVKNLTTGNQGIICGIYDVGLPGTKLCQNNQIFNFSTPAGTSTSSNSYLGIVYANFTTSTLPVTISGNSIYSFNNLSSAAAAIRGVFCNSNQPSFIYNNKIYDLAYGGTNANLGASIYGIYTIGDESTIYNNVISDLRMPNNTVTAQRVSGINVTNKVNVYYNTVLLSGTNTSSAAMLASTAFGVILRNNIFINNTTPVAGGIASAYSRTDATLTSYDATSNNNLFVGSTIFYDGTNNDTTLAAYKTRMATRDQASVTETTTPFTSVVGSNADFLRLPANAVSVANNAGVPITTPAITTDYFGVTRSTTTPDIGASEFNGLVCTLPVAYTVTGGGSACGTSVAVGLSNSETGISYQLKRNGTATGSAIAGTGAALAFPNQTVSGTYTVDANNSNASCAQTVVAMTGSAVVTIDVPSVGGTVAGSAAKCSSTNSGTLTLSGNTGAVVRWESAVSPFSTWSAIANTTLTNNYTNLSATTQFRAVVQNGSCVSVTSSVATVTVSLINFTGTVQNVSCFGGSNGSLSFTGQGGVAPYTYLWNTGATTNAITGLTAGSYSCTITDAVGCSRLISPVVVTQPAALEVTQASQTNISCFGGSNGVASINTPTGGTGLYSYNWTPGNPAGDGTRNVTGLTAGTWTCTVTDSNGCTLATSFTVTQPSAAVSGTTVVTNATCNGTSNGAINLTPSGGTAPYTFNWGGGVTTEDRTGLVAGSYSVTITDANLCTGVVNATVTQPSAIVAGSAQTNIACFGGSNGTASVFSVTGGAGGYTYDWSPGTPSGDGTATITGLTIGNWTCTITDSNGCTALKTVTIRQPAAAISGTTVVTNVACLGGVSGAINLSPSGGTAPYTFLWNDGARTEDRTGRAAGTYSVTITDDNACSATISGITVGQPATAVTGTTVVTNIACNGGTNGAINLTPTGGNGPYTFNWGGGITTEDRTGLAAGTYSVTITDFNGCSGVVSGITVTQPTTALNGTAVITTVACNGGSNGAINLTPSGGTPPYTFSWIGGVTTEDRTGLVSGNYFVTITDANNCSRGLNFFVSEPTALGGTLNRTNATCFGGNNGTLNLTPSGGTAPYTYLWSDGVTTEDRTNLIAGNYSVVVTDVNGCSTTLNQIVSQPATAVSGTTVVTNVSCNGSSDGAIVLTPTGGAAPYTFNWGTITTKDRTGLAAGTYSVTITDANGCTGVVSGIEVTQPAAITPTFTQVAPICSGGTLSALPTTSNNSIVGTWLPALDNTTTTTYTFTPNSGQCGTTATMTITVNVTAQPTRDNNISSTLCNNATIGTLISKFNNSSNVLCYSAPTGGSPLNASQLIAPVNAGVVYYLTQTVSGCESTRLAYSAFVNFIQPPTATNPQNFCSGATIANLSATPASGASISGWFTASTGGSALPSTTLLTSSTYYVGQSHQSGCALERTAVNVTVLNVDGTITQSSGVLSATQNGANYQWYSCPNTLISGATNQTFTPTVLGDYKATITQNGCTVTSNCITVTTLGTSDFDSTSFSCYPNPTNGILNVNYSSEISKVEVSNMLGQNVLSQTNNSKEAQIDMQFLPSGTYLVKISSEDKTKTIKIVKQ